jgi:hypothetical protein
MIRKVTVVYKIGSEVIAILIHNLCRTCVVAIIDPSTYLLGYCRKVVSGCIGKVIDMIAYLAPDVQVNCGDMTAVDHTAWSNECHYRRKVRGHINKLLPDGSVA